MSQKLVGKFAEIRFPRPRFTIGSLLALFAVISLSIAAFQFAWP